jgi:hypothetical protein
MPQIAASKAPNVPETTSPNSRNGELSVPSIPNELKEVPVFFFSAEEPGTLWI